jgi:hypothetical protein
MLAEVSVVVSGEVVGKDLLEKEEEGFSLQRAQALIVWKRIAKGSGAKVLEEKDTIE